MVFYKKGRYYKKYNGGLSDFPNHFADQGLQPPYFGTPEWCCVHYNYPFSTHREVIGFEPGLFCVVLVLTSDPDFRGPRARAARCAALTRFRRVSTPSACRSQTWRKLGLVVRTSALTHINKI